MRRDADAVIVGGGSTGIATLRALARTGLAAILLEQFEVGHARGSSHGTSRIFRLAYPDVRFVRLAQRALAGWRELEAEAGEQLIVRTGSLDIGDLALENAAALESCGVPYELLDARTAQRRWPISAGEDERLLFQPDGGTTLAEKAMGALLAGAGAAGAEIAAGSRVTGIRAGRESVVIDSTAGEITARAVVVAAGAWARQVLEPLGIALDVAPTRETVSFFPFAGAEEIPAVIDYALLPPGSSADDGQAAYALAAPGVGLKAGLHRTGSATDPDLPGVVADQIVAQTADWVAQRFPQADPKPLASETCIYTNTPDHDFVLERQGRVVVASACSGHGFKFAPVLGETISALVHEAL